MAVNVPSYENGRLYGPPSSMGTQLVDFFYQRKPLIDLKKEQYFGQLADVFTMPRNHGKTIKQYQWVPMLDDRNINDQGIDATGLSITDEVTITITDPVGMERYAVGNGSNAATALTAAKAKAVDIFKNLGITATDYAAYVTLVTAAGWKVVENAAVNNGGNLYGSSKDVGTIVGKLPLIGETGGRVNRVGFKRLMLQGTMENFGFFSEYSEDSVNFDTEADLMSHISRETLRGANEIVEDMLQKDLLNAGNIVFYGGKATSTSQLTGNNGETASELTYDMLTRLELVLNESRCSKSTTLIKGSNFTDTRTIAGARYAYVGAELRPTLLRMKDYHDKPAFVPIHQYADAGNIARGEIGSIGGFRFIEVPEMQHWDGVGKAVTTNDGYMESNGKYNAYPLLVVGDKSFTTVGFQQSGEQNKFKIITKKPGSETADRTDPYGKMGFYSIQWWYGFMVLRPEWIALLKVVARR